MRWLFLPVLVASVAGASAPAVARLGNVDLSAAPGPRPYELNNVARNHT